VQCVTPAGTKAPRRVKCGRVEDGLFRWERGVELGNWTVDWTGACTVTATCSTGTATASITIGQWSVTAERPLLLSQSEFNPGPPRVRSGALSPSWGSPKLPNLCEVEFEPAIREDPRVDQAQRPGTGPGVAHALALTEHHRVHPQLNMHAARWPN